MVLENDMLFDDIIGMCIHDRQKSQQHDEKGQIPHRFSP